MLVVRRLFLLMHPKVDILTESRVMCYVSNGNQCALFPGENWLLHFEFLPFLDRMGILRVDFWIRIERHRGFKFELARRVLFTVYDSIKFSLV